LRFDHEVVRQTHDLLSRTNGGLLVVISDGNQVSHVTLLLASTGSIPALDALLDPRPASGVDRCRRPSENSFKDSRDDTGEQAQEQSDAHFPVRTLIVSSPDGGGMRRRARSTFGRSSTVPLLSAGARRRSRLASLR